MTDILFHLIYVFSYVLILFTMKLCTLHRDTSRTAAFFFDSLNNTQRVGKVKGEQRMETGEKKEVERGNRETGRINKEEERYKLS